MANLSEPHTQSRLKELRDAIHTAIKHDDVMTLSTCLDELQAKASPNDFATTLPFSLMLAGTLGKSESFHLLLLKIRDFKPPTYQATFRQLIKHRHDHLRRAFLSRMKIYSPDLYTTFATERLIIGGAQNGRIDIIQEAFNNGARHDADMYGNSKPLSAAISAMQMGATAFLLEKNATLGNVIALMNDVFENGIHPNTIPMVELLLGHGMQIRGDQRHTLQRFMLHREDLGEDIGSKIEEVLDRWEQRGRYIELPARIKPLMRLQDMALPFPTGTNSRQMTTLLHRLASADRFEEVIRVGQKNGESLNFVDLTRPDPNGNTVIDIMGARKTLNLLEQCSFSKGQEGRFLTLINNLPPIYRQQVNLGDIRHNLTLQAMERIPRRKLILRRRPF